MNKHFRIQLTVILIIFSLLISLVIALFDYERLKERVNITHEEKILMAENEVVKTLHMIDKAYLLFDQDRADEMENYSKVLIDLYSTEPDFNMWDFNAFKEKFGMDVFIINSENVVINSSFTGDIGLDFEKCCKSLAKVLHQRRKGETFHHDGMDIHQKTGEIKKFSYMPTPDHKYIIELGVLLQDDVIFKQFNFLTTIESLIEDYDAINNINVYTSGGLLLGYTTQSSVPEKIEDDVHPIFKDVLAKNEAQEITQIKEGNKVTYRYIPYSADQEKNLSTTRVVEIAYNDAELEGLLSYYRRELIAQLLVIIFASIILSWFIASLVSKPIYLAFHDSLTGLKNRAAFEDEIKKRLSSKNKNLALMMIDLDNFKSVNDVLGHSEGDQILKFVGKTIQDIATQKNVASRIGGDEFVVVFSGVQKKDIQSIARMMVEKINTEFLRLKDTSNIDVSISMGIAFSIAGDEINTLYDRADSALYTSKKNGKNQFTIYED
ncbi:GGDEF domain-containing protein [Sporosarcina sp. FA9]|uniref:GGDEF domain-containing protein n=1 Tax=Sporosarcina sp. FA9 TaxID=3413030 RepID=UPI003F65DA17